MSETIDRRALLAAEAEELAVRCQALARRVTVQVDRIAALDAHEAAMRLGYLSEMLDEAGR